MVSPIICRVYSIVDAILDGVEDAVVDAGHTRLSSTGVPTLPRGCEASLGSSPASSGGQLTRHSNISSQLIHTQVGTAHKLTGEIFYKIF